MKTQRNLTNAQHRALDRIARNDPAAKVVGWDEQVRGPLVRYSTGEISSVGKRGHNAPMRIAA